MNEENAFSLLQLTDQISRARQVQLTAIDQAVIRLNCAKSSGECRTAAGVAIFLAYLGTRVETLIRKEICAAYREIEKLQELPDQTQWDYRCAHTLGLSEGLNRAGAIQAKIIEQAQASLHKASILLMAQSEYNALPARALATKGPKSKFQLDCLQSIVQELNPRQGNRPGNANRLALQLSGAYLQRAISSQGSSDLTISTIFTTAMDFVLANILASLSAFAREAVDFGAYFEDPSPNSKRREYGLARLIAAGIVSVFVTDLIKQNAPWVSVNLN